MNASNTAVNRTLSIRHIITIGVGDMLALLGFAALGRASHEIRTDNPFLDTLLTATPFIVAWAVVAPPFSVWAERRLQAFDSWGKLMVLTELTWLVAAPLGLVLRALILDRPIVLVFALVTLGVAGGILAFCRSVYWVVYRRVLS